MRFTPGLLAERLAPLIAAAGPVPLTLALSGGADSAALAHALVALARGEPRLRLRSLHIDHGLTPAAGALAASAARLAAELGLAHACQAVEVSDLAREGLEAAARRARYRAFAAFLAPGEGLVTAHHQGDQAETLLLQLLRGAGVKGLAAMPARAPLGPGVLLRPLLAVPGHALLEYAREAGLEWCEDPMNADPRFDRVYLRQEVLPRLLARWPAAHATLARASRHLASAERLIEADAARALAPLVRGAAVSIAGLLELEAGRRAAVLRHYLASRGLPMLPARRLAVIERELLRARGTGVPRLCWPGAELSVYAGLLYAFAPLPPPAPPAPLALATGEIALGLLGRLRVSAATGAGLAAGRAAAPLVLGARQGGERLRLAPLGARRPLKDLLREARVPPWARSRLPLVFDGPRLAAVVLPHETWVAAEWQAAPGEPGLRVEWQDAPSVFAPAATLEVSPAGGFG